LLRVIEIEKRAGHNPLGAFNFCGRISEQILLLVLLAGHLASGNYDGRRGKQGSITEGAAVDS
jgi:hypothetical protein